MIRSFLVMILLYAGVANAGEPMRITNREEAAECIKKNMKPLTEKTEVNGHLFDLAYLANKALGRDAKRSPTTADERRHVHQVMIDVMVQQRAGLTIHYDTVVMLPAKRWNKDHQPSGSVDITFEGTRTNYDFDAWLKPGFCQLQDLSIPPKPFLTAALRDRYLAAKADARQ